VLVVDDSWAVREAIGAVLGEQPDMLVVGSARDGREAVRMAMTLEPHVITMDIHMPGVSGLDAIAEIMWRRPSRILVVCAVDDSTQLDLSFRAVAAGALELIAKPGPGIGFREWGHRLVESIRLMSEVPPVRRGPARTNLQREPLTRRGGRVAAFGLAASTGGPPALAAILGALPAELPIPVFIAQHMAPGFSAGLVRWLAGVTRLRVMEAPAAAVALPGHVYLPPDGHDLWVDDFGAVRTSGSSSLSCPSGDRLLESLASAYKERSAGAVLTGMGEDGAEGLLAIQSAGGITMAQDAATSVVYGMPQAAVRRGATDSVMPLPAIAPAIVDLCMRPSSIEEL
jgi:two-component system chemotaxis response regulator CheB